MSMPLNPSGYGIIAINNLAEIADNFHRDWETPVNGSAGMYFMEDADMDMNGLTNSGYTGAAASPRLAKESRTGSAAKSESSERKTVGGRTIGEPKLSDKALKYYEQLKQKYSNMDFILVSPEMKEEAESKKGTYKSNKELLVLIDSDKIEEMAANESVRKQYENILSSATAQVAQMKMQMGSNADRVRSFGMTFDDKGTASFFAVVDKSLAAQRERIATKREDNAKGKKEASEKAQAKKAEKAKENKRTGTKESGREESDSVMVTANSWNELLRKIDEVIITGKTDKILTEQEQKIGQKFDLTL